MTDTMEITGRLGGIREYSMMNMDEFGYLLHDIRKHKHIRVFRMHYFALPPIAWNEIIRVLDKHPEMEVLDMSSNTNITKKFLYNSLEWTPFDNGISELGCLKNIRSLNLSQAVFYVNQDPSYHHHISIFDLSRFLQQTTTLEKLYLDSIEFMENDEYGCLDELQDAIAKNRSLRYLSMRHWIRWRTSDIGMIDCIIDNPTLCKVVGLHDDDHMTIKNQRNIIRTNMINKICMHLTLHVKLPMEIWMFIVKMCVPVAYEYEV